MKIILIIIALLFAPTVPAMNDTYLQAVQQVKEKSYVKAAALFRSQLPSFENNSVFRNRTRVWLSLSLLAEDKLSQEAEAVLLQVLCEAQNAQYIEKIIEVCHSSNFWAPKTQIDSDIVSAAVATYGSIQWRRDNYKTAIQLMDISLQRALAENSQNSDLAPSLTQLDSAQPVNPEKAISKEQNRQALIKEQLKSQLLKKLFSNKGQLNQDTFELDAESQQQLAESYKREIIARKQKELTLVNPNLTREAVPGNYQSFLDMLKKSQQQNLVAQNKKRDCIIAKIAEHRQKLVQEFTGQETDYNELVKKLQKNAEENMAECNSYVITNSEHPQKSATRVENLDRKTKLKNEQARRQFSKIAASEPKIFYRLAKSTMCQSVDAMGDTPVDIQQVQSAIQKRMAAALEAYRGQYVQGFKIAQRPVLKQLNNFLDRKKLLQQDFNPLSQSRDSFLESLASCSDSLNLEEVFGQALLVALTRPSRPHRNEKYIRLLISTAHRLRENSRSNNPFAATQEKAEHQALANFYLRSHQPDKALSEFQQALGNYKLAILFNLTPEMAYIHLKSEAKSLQGLVAATQQSSENVATLEQALNDFRSDLSTLNAEIENRLSLSPEQLMAVQLEDMKPKIKETMQSKKMKSALQMMESMIQQSGQDPDRPNPLAQIKQLFNSINNGAMDDKILESAQQLGESTLVPIRDEILGNLLERQHQLYNSHAQLLLQLVHINLELKNTDAASRQMHEAETYLRDRTGWVGDRTRAYEEFTRARLLSIGKSTSEASQAFADAVRLWYSTPHSMTETVFPILEQETDVLEQAGAFSISQGQSSKALYYFELAREVQLKGNQLYGALSEQDLAAEDQSLQRQALEMKEMAAERAHDQGETEIYESALQKAAAFAQQSRRQQLDPVYNLLTRIEPLKRWLKSEDLGRFVENVMQQVYRRQALSLNRERIGYLYQQQDLQGPKVNYLPPALRKGNDMTLSTKIQQKISDKTLLISVWIGRNSSYVTAVDRKDVRAHQHPSRPLLELIKVFNDTYKQSYGYKLYQQLLAPYLNRSYSRIILVVNGPLQNTAFAALSTDQGKQAWFGDRYLLRTLPYASQLLKTVKPKSRPIKVLVLNGASVPGEVELVTDEIGTIFQNFTGKQIAAEQLTKTNLIEQIPRYPIVHFAGHSEVNNEFPDFSHLVLYNDKAYLLELEQLSLEEVKLIVMGSCESATHADSNFGNQFSSLHESLMNAGAESVLANLFPVKDHVASKFMSRFYELLAQGHAKDRALQQAQQFVRTKNPDPIDWAGFILSGSELPL